MELAALSATAAATAPPCSLQAAATQLHLHPCTPGLWKHHRMLTKRHHFFALLHCVAFCLWQFCCLTRCKGLALPFSVLHSKFCFHSTTPHLTKDVAPLQPACAGSGWAVHTKASTADADGSAAFTCCCCCFPLLCSPCLCPHQNQLGSIWHCSLWQNFGCPSGAVQLPDQPHRHHQLVHSASVN